jgi:hypothetical protein
MPGYSPQQLNYNVLNANQVMVQLGDAIIAFAQTAPHSVDFGTEALYGVGDATPQEEQQLRILPQITLEFFALTAEGISLLGGNQRLAYILANNQFQIHLMDSQSNTVLFTYVDCVAQNFTETLVSNRPVIDSVPFLSMDVLDSNGNSILASNSAIAPGLFVTASTNQTGLGI